MVFFFTATGNSLYVAKKLEEDPISIPQALKNNKLEYTCETVGIVCPVFSGELPAIVCEFLKKVKLNAEYVYMVLTYGNDETVAAKEGKKFAEKCGINVNYIATIKMVDNFLPVFDVSQQIKEDKKTDLQIEKAIKDISERKNYLPKVTFKGKALYNVVKRMHNAHPEQINGQILTVKDNCTRCGICTKVCPEKNFKVENSKAFRVRETCNFCLSCANNCPEKAIGFTSSEKNPNARYRHENISLEEIIKANDQT